MKLIESYEVLTAKGNLLKFYKDGKDLRVNLPDKRTAKLCYVTGAANNKVVVKFDDVEEMEPKFVTVVRAGDTEQIAKVCIKLQDGAYRLQCLLGAIEEGKKLYEFSSAEEYKKSKEDAFDEYKKLKNLKNTRLGCTISMAFLASNLKNTLNLADVLE